jgi:hypothetical protein
MSGVSMPVKPTITSAANLSYQGRIDRLADLADAGDWPAVEAYEVKGQNTYAKLVMRFRDDLLAAHVAGADPTLYGPSQIKSEPTLYEAKRKRSTKNDVLRRRERLYDIVRAMQPMTVRQVFYQATVRGLVEKSESGYGMVQTDLTVMRRSGVLPYDWLADHTRWQRKPRTFSSVEQALNDTARLYRKALWADADAYVEVWLEKDALAGVVWPITALYDVPLMVARGYASLSFLHDAAEYIGDLDVPIFIYHCGDFDPSGVNAGEKIEETLREMAPDADIHFERIAVTREQINTWDLPTRPTKTTDTRSKGFGNISVELDAIEPERLRELVQAAIERHMPAAQFDVLKVAEQDEKRLIMGLVGTLSQASGPA